MGNTNSNTKSSSKIDILKQLSNDISFNVVDQVIQTARQYIQVNQEQDVIINNADLKDCEVNILQNAEINAKINAIFISIPTSKNQYFDFMVEIVNNIINNQNSIITDFINLTKMNLNCITDEELKLKMKFIMKVNIENTTKQECESLLSLKQKQNVLLQNIKCENSKININQNAIVKVISNCLFQSISSSIIKDNRIKTAIRQFNGEYDNLTEPLNENVILPFIFTGCKKQNCSSYTDCLECPKCPNLIEIDNKQKVTNLTIYLIIIIILFITLLSIIKTFF